jgi:hypothetical protein
MHFNYCRRSQQSLGWRRSGKPTDVHMRRSGRSPSDADATTSGFCVRSQSACCERGRSDEIDS